MAVDSLDSCGVYFGTTGGQVYASADGGDTLDADRPRPAAGLLGGGADAAMIRVDLPAHLRTLARVERRSRGRSVEGPVTQRAVLDALEVALSGAARHDPRPRHAAAPRRSCGSSPARQDLSHEPPDAPLPDAVARGDEPFLVVGAMSGG